ACYSEDTQTLTENGWKYYWEIKDEKVATFNPETGKIEYHNPIKKLVYEHDGKMYHYFTPKGVDLLVTPEHRIWYKKTFEEKWNLEPAKDIKFSRVDFLAVAGWDGEEKEEITINENIKFKMDDWLEFLGYFVSEGYVAIPENTNKGFRIQITQKDKKKVNKIQKCLQNLGLSFKSYFSKNDECTIFLIHNKELWSWLRENIGTHSFNKKMPDFLKMLSYRQLEIFFNAYMLGDGYYGKRETDHNATATTISKELADDLQEIGLKLGYKTKLKSILSDNPKRADKYRLDFVINDQAKKDWATPRIDLKKNLKIEQYKGFVYCFEVPNHLFITRRNGVVAIQGNTPEIQQGIVSKRARTLGELELVSAKV
ncbi:hypothetical protein GW950_02290, partial [Candidatus Wolfebacteria bacterium]|nr:hypothetical protein [Candidatus Wolfebacteria bacterium]